MSKIRYQVPEYFHFAALWGILSIYILAWSPLPSYAQIDGFENPSERSGFVLGYDEERERIVLFGGQDTVDDLLGDTWEWFDDDWHSVQLTTSPPSPRINAALAYEPPNERFILFGGIDRTGHRNDTWSYSDGKWIPIDTGNAPSPRQLATAAYDRKSGHLVLFGGRTSEGERLGDTWIFEQTAGRRSRVSVPQPGPLILWYMMRQ